MLSHVVVKQEVEALHRSYLKVVLNLRIVDIVTAAAPLHAFLDFYIRVLHTTFFLRHWLCSHLTIVETIIRGSRRMNPVAITFFKSRKKCAIKGIQTKNPFQISTWLLDSASKLRIQFCHTILADPVSIHSAMHGE